jgi:hypothetical protein
MYEKKLWIYSPMYSSKIFKEIKRIGALLLVPGRETTIPPRERITING